MVNFVCLFVYLRNWSAVSCGHRCSVILTTTEFWSPRGVVQLKRPLSCVIWKCLYGEGTTVLRYLEMFIWRGDHCPVYLQMFIWRGDHCPELFGNVYMEREPLSCVIWKRLYGEGTTVLCYLETLMDGDCCPGLLGKSLLRGPLPHLL